VVKVNEIISDSPSLNGYMHFIEGIKKDLCLFRSFRVVHVRREANLTAHVLARAAVTHVIEYSIWLKEISPNIYDIVSRERNVALVRPFSLFLSQ